LAEASGVSITVIRKLEQDGGQAENPQGVRLGTLYALARALNVQTAQLFPTTGPQPADQDPAQLALMPIRIALTPPLLTVPNPEKPRPGLELPTLRSAIAQCIQLYDRDRYEQVSARLPDLLITARSKVLAPENTQPDHAALGIRSEVHQLAGWFLTQVGAHDLAYQAVRDALADAMACGDAFLSATCVIGECWLLIRQGRLLDAKRVAIVTADRVEPSRLREANSEEFAVWGWLLLMAWAAAVRNNQEDEAREFLRVARSAAAGSATRQARYGRYWSILGPATIGMKEVEHEVVTGNYRHALSLAERVRPDQVVRADNRQRHLLDLAIAHVELGQRADAVPVFTNLRTTAPQWLRHQRPGREAARKLVSAPVRALSPEIRALADFYDFGASRVSEFLGEVTELGWGRQERLMRRDGRWVLICR
jgi:hypothetical protein